MSIHLDQLLRNKEIQVTRLLAANQRLKARLRRYNSDYRDPLLYTVQRIYQFGEEEINNSRNEYLGIGSLTLTWGQPSTPARAEDALPDVAPVRNTLRLGLPPSTPVPADQVLPPPAPAPAPAEQGHPAVPPSPIFRRNRCRNKPGQQADLISVRWGQPINTNTAAAAARSTASTTPCNCPGCGKRGFSKCLKCGKRRMIVRSVSDKDSGPIIDIQK